MEKIKWIERTFNFDFPVETFPMFFERLKGTPARIEELIKNIPESKLEMNLNKKWSVKEHIGHLIDLEELHEGRIEDFNNKLVILRAADMSNKKTVEALHNKKTIGNLIFTFRNARENFCDHLKNKNTTELSLVSIHPRLNTPMRLIDMVYFVAEHDDQHLASMREITDSLHS